MHKNCLMCGENNPSSLGLNFIKQMDNSVVSDFHGEDRLQGYDGILHGGVISSLLDSAMTNCLLADGIIAVTGELKVRFLRSIPIDSQVKVSGWLEKAAPPLFRLRSEIRGSDGVYARGEAKFMQVALSES